MALFNEKIVARFVISVSRKERGDCSPLGGFTCCLP